MDAPDAAAFEPLALEVFAHQFDEIEPYRRYCRTRGESPASVRHWEDIPPVPVLAFKQEELSCSPPRRVFLSTGTTAGLARRSRHLMPDPRLYEQSAVEGMRRYLFPDVRRLPLLSLIPPASQQEESSLAQMVAWALEVFGDSNSAYLSDGDVLDLEGFADRLRAAERSGQTPCILTTTAALVRFFEFIRNRGLSFRLPHGSRIMDTGGNKGAPRMLSRRGLRHLCWNLLAVPGYFCVNEYGMAELSSQFYDTVIAARTRGRFRRRCKEGPPWARTRIVDPINLAPVPQGDVGLLCHYDLANAGSAMAVLTEDLGRQLGTGFEVVGRAAGAERRGCSMTLSEWGVVDE